MPAVVRLVRVRLKSRFVRMLAFAPPAVLREVHDLLASTTAAPAKEQPFLLHATSGDLRATDYLPSATRH